MTPPAPGTDSSDETSEEWFELPPLVLSPRDSRIFAEAILDDREPGEALLKAARRAETRILLPLEVLAVPDSRNSDEG